MSDPLLAALGPRPLCLSPHPDDEAWAFGGLLAALADTPARPALLCLTAAPDTLRARELRASWAALGGLPDDLHLAGLADGELGAAAVLAAVSPLVEALSPSALLTFGPDGGYGHRDHVAVWQAVEHLSSFVFHVKYAVCWPVFPDAAARFAPLRAHLARAAPTLIAPEARPLPPRATTFRFPLSPTVVARKRAALACHASQLPRGGVDTFLGRAVMAPLFIAEHYACAAPPDDRARQPDDAP